MNTQPMFPVPCDAKSLFDPLSDDGLQRVQEELDVQVPSELVDFLREWNEILFSHELRFPFKGAENDDEFGTVYRLYGMAPENDSDDLRYAGAGYHFSSRVPSRFLAIGDNNIWDRLCISIGKPDFGQVCYWEPGEGWPPKEEVATTDYMRPVADSFSEFWKCLTVLELD